ncbi:hypothetical protein CCACVL1_05997 [Corchorus capsularis]|uniref:Uncharacterized protein n=1 Tax=Corchorus capsularis TaxID=210143 RepID=A0A1R3JI05_COCAP|nr:hypothetical protein CCACVL1_05997 [Corchorus capsularis]
MIASSTETVVSHIASATTSHVAWEKLMNWHYICEYELVIHALNGVGSEYKELAAGIRARESYISFEELMDKFVDYEEALKKQQGNSEFNIPTVQPKGTGPVANVSTTQSPAAWLVDSGANHHVTNGVQNLQFAQEYAGPDDLLIGDGTGLAHKGASGTRPG